MTRNDPVQPADLIFVLAGGMDRKQYGLQLYRRGIAPLLLLSVGRFEISRMQSLDLKIVDELKFQRDGTSPEERHFFVHVHMSGMHVEKVKLPRWSTYGETLMLREVLEEKNVERVLVVSTATHLRRVAFTFSKVFRGEPIEFRYTPVPANLDSVGEKYRWTSRDDVTFVLKEALKLIAYWGILSLPSKWVPRLMRLKAVPRA